LKAFYFAKQGGNISAPAWAVAFCFAKQGGMYEHLSCGRLYCTELY